ncbi:hypothetical protein V5E97_34875 [Singulisphaera sp. Ch08]|uniref:Uncharacterized protein n=1 Tax=Singulisphaera sp. Ch08 TaxID=3120278 RepID=A0AAU7CFM1_9BACT
MSVLSRHFSGLLGGGHRSDFPSGVPIGKGTLIARLASKVRLARAISRLAVVGVGLSQLFADGEALMQAGSDDGIRRTRLRLQHRRARSLRRGVRDPSYSHSCWYPNPTDSNRVQLEQRL